MYAILSAVADVARGCIAVKPFSVERGARERSVLISAWEVPYSWIPGGGLRRLLIVISQYSASKLEKFLIFQLN